MKSSNEDKHWQTASRSRARPPFPNPAGPTVAPSLGGSTEGGRDSQRARLERPGNRISLEGKCKML